MSIGMMSENMVREDGRGPVAVAGPSTRKVASGWEKGMRATSLGWEDDGKQLLPGILEEITLNIIVPKLPWRAFPALSSVSRGWRKVIHNCQVYEARVSSHSTEAFLAISHLSRDMDVIGRRTGDIDAISLYSMTDSSVHQLPGIPQLQGGIPRACQGIVLDGKLYVLGGVKDLEATGTEPHVMHLTGSEDMYMLNLAGLGQWKQCASMQAGRLRFGCAVLDKKIYVFGGTSRMDPVFEAEVYDPELDAWSSIPPLISQRFNHRVAKIGKELVLYGGCRYVDRYPAWTRLLALNPGIISDFISDAISLEVYHPCTRRWRNVEFIDLERIFMAQERFHVMTLDGILVQDAGIDGKLWENLHTFVEPLPNYPDFKKGSALTIDDRLLAVAILDEEDEEDEENVEDSLCLLECKGFGSDISQLRWESVNCPLSFHDYEPPFMCAIRL